MGECRGGRVRVGVVWCWGGRARDVHARGVIQSWRLLERVPRLLPPGALVPLI